MITPNNIHITHDTKNAPNMYYIIIINPIRKSVLLILHCISGIIPGGLRFTEYSKNHSGFSRESRNPQIHIYLLSTIFILIFKG